MPPCATDAGSSGNARGNARINLDVGETEQGVESSEYLIQRYQVVACWPNRRESTLQRGSEIVQLLSCWGCLVPRAARKAGRASGLACAPCPVVVHAASQLSSNRIQHLPNSGCEPCAFRFVGGCSRPYVIGQAPPVLQERQERCVGLSGIVGNAVQQSCQRPPLFRSERRQFGPSRPTPDVTTHQK